MGDEKSCTVKSLSRKHLICLAKFVEFLHNTSIMIQWYEPYNTKEWLKRIFSIQHLVIFLVAASLVVAELRFDWCERLTGGYLASGNGERPEIGAVWRTGARVTKAQDYLENVIGKKQDAARHAKDAISFQQLAETIAFGQWTTLDKDHFKKLYLALPSPEAARFIQPAELVWLLGSTDIQRIFCEGTQDGLGLYFLDLNNRVMKKLSLNRGLLKLFEEKGASFEGGLEEIPGFGERLYPAAVFFKALLDLPQEIVSDLITDPERLLREEGDLVRAGIGSSSESGHVELGFEFESSGRRSVVLVKGREWAVWLLSVGLDKEAE